MILKKVIEDNKTKYEEISFDEAIKLPKDQLVFTDEDEEDDFDDYLEDLEDEEDEEDDDDSDTIIINESNGENSSRIVYDYSDYMPKHDFSSKSDNKKKPEYLKILPFLGKDELSKIVDKIIAGEYEEDKINVITMMPFLRKSDCDRLFMYAITHIKDNPLNKRVNAMAPFVSSECLEKLVDDLIENPDKYEDISFDGLYPFMDSGSIKKLFNYFINKK